MTKYRVNQYLFSSEKMETIKTVKYFKILVSDVLFFFKWNITIPFVKTAPAVSGRLWTIHFCQVIKMVRPVCFPWYNVSLSKAYKIKSLNNSSHNIFSDYIAWTDIGISFPQCFENYCYSFLVVLMNVRCIQCFSTEDGTMNFSLSMDGKTKVKPQK